jgi:hypothetical protein
MKFIIFWILILFTDLLFALDINLNTGIILKGHFEVNLDSKDDIYFIVDIPQNLNIYINYSKTPIKRFKIIYDDWDNYIEYYGFEELIDSMVNYPSFVSGNFVLRNPNDIGSEILLNIIDIIFEYDKNDYRNRGLDFQNMYKYLYDDFLVEGELFYIRWGLLSGRHIYMEIYGKVVAITIDQYIIDNFIEIFEKNPSAKIKKEFTLQWRGSGTGTLYDEENDWSYITDFGLYIIKDYKNM